MEFTNVVFAFSLTLFAGLSTGVGSALAMFSKRNNTRFLAVALGFSAGVMIYVSMVELLNEAQRWLTGELGARTGAWVTTAAFFGGMLLIGLIDRLIPAFENPHEPKAMSKEAREQRTGSRAFAVSDEPAGSSSLLRIGILTAIAIAVHNFPEGIAAFTSALREPQIAIPIVIAIAIHNIPEGIAVSVPIFYATGRKSKAFWYSLASGLSEPAGALLGYLILAPYLTDIVFGILFAAVAGIMVFISVDELLPASRQYGEHHYSVYGLVGGMMLMAVSLQVLN
jgi:ZIP family zinc transporter